MDDAVDPADARLGGVRPSAIPLDRAVPMRFAGEDAVMFKNVRPATRSGKVELASPISRRSTAPGCPTSGRRSSYPLILITPASDERVTSTFGGLPSGDRTPPLEMHPDDARARGLADGAGCGCGTTSARCTCRSRSPTPCGRASCARSRARGSRRATTGRRSPPLAPAHHADISGRRLLQRHAGGSGRGIPVSRALLRALAVTLVLAGSGPRRVRRPLRARRPRQARPRRPRRRPP